jgi:hypothetical protein
LYCTTPSLWLRTASRFSSGVGGHVSIATTNRYIEIDLAMKAKALETCTVGKAETPPASWRQNPDILVWLESL